MNSNIQINRLQTEEVYSFWQLFKKILQQGFPDYSPKVQNYFLNRIYTPSAFTHWVRKKRKTVFLARKKEEPVGFAVLDAPYGGVCFCRWLGVLEKERRKGIGGALVKRWIAYAKEKKCHKVEIASQEEAVGFYKKVGLQKEGYRKKSYFGIDQYIFGKVIGDPDEQAMVSS